jgi:peptide/nickel transport system substrate-binding protein/oligopeptide transport system substrate-binding protein
VNRATIEANGDAWATKPRPISATAPSISRSGCRVPFILFAKNPYYWTLLIKLDTMKMLLIEDPTASYAAYQSGEAMMIRDVPVEGDPALKGNPNFTSNPYRALLYLPERCKARVLRSEGPPGSEPGA